MKFHFDKVQNLAGFVVENTKQGDIAPVLVRALLTSDDPEFYQYSEHISSIFLNGKILSIDAVHQFLVVIHKDLSADMYINDFAVLIEIKPKRDIKAGETVLSNDIADLRKVKFQDIEIKKTDKIIYCFKVGWRFGLFFDLTFSPLPTDKATSIATKELDIDEMEISIGELRRYLAFYHVYKSIESEAHFGEMMKDGWFPFIEILAGDYKKLSEAYTNKFNFEANIKSVVDSFSNERIKKITDKWWEKELFQNKKALIEPGIDAFNQGVYVNCIKNLWTEIEGILRELYYIETSKGNGIKSQDLIDHITEKGKKNSGSELSLLLPKPFLKYLQEVVFAKFNVETGQVDMSRHSSSHGVASPEQYTKERALQVILILDQIYFYI